MRVVHLAPALLVALAACRPERASGCPSDLREGAWRLHAADPRGGVLDATVSLDEARPRVKGTVRWAEGAGEALDFPLDSVRVAGDSVSFAFAPVVVRVWARCIAADSLDAAVRYGARVAGTDTLRGYLRRP